VIQRFPASFNLDANPVSMKMNVSLFSVGLFLVSSLLLQGCDWFTEAENRKHKKTLKDDDVATATCDNGKFSCTGNFKKWCAEQEKRCTGEGSLHGSGSCTPKCTWQCATPKCDQVCAPKCNQPICTTRCKGINTNSCKMQCGKPDCKVVCPKQFCAGKHCAKCKTECGKPKCELKCGKDEQPCRNLCAQPHCKWECNGPKEQDCPKPQCSMKCEKPRKCMDNTYMVEKLPPLMPGETEVNKDHATEYNAPASLAQISSALHAKASMRVNLTTMGADRSLQQSQMDLEMAAMEDPTSTSWTRTIREHDGRAIESESSCNHGSFQCKGDMHWCKQQRKKVVCRSLAEDPMVEDQQAEEAAVKALQDVDRSLFLQQRSTLLGHLRA